MRSLSWTNFDGLHAKVSRVLKSYITIDDYAEQAAAKQQERAGRSLLSIWVARHQTVLSFVVTCNRWDYRTVPKHTIPA